MAKKRAQADEAKQTGMGFSDAENLPEDVKRLSESYREALAEKNKASDEWKERRNLLVQAMKEHGLKQVPTIDGKKLVLTQSEGIKLQAVKGDENGDDD